MEKPPSGKSYSDFGHASYDEQDYNKLGINKECVWKMDEQYQLTIKCSEKSNYQYIGHDEMEWSNLLASGRYVEYSDDRPNILTFVLARDHFITPSAPRKLEKALGMLNRKFNDPIIYDYSKRFA